MLNNPIPINSKRNLKQIGSQSDLTPLKIPPNILKKKQSFNDIQMEHLRNSPLGSEKK